MPHVLDDDEAACGVVAIKDLRDGILREVPRDQRVTALQAEIAAAAATAPTNWSALWGGLRTRSLV